MDEYFKNIQPLNLKHTITNQIKKKYVGIIHKPVQDSVVKLKESKLHPLKRKEKREFQTERRIDLHGATRDEAFCILLKFFISCQREGVRKVLVITGGNALRETVLRKSFKMWVQESFGNYIVSCSPANIWDGGQGAFYVVLKRKERC